ncbi:MAG: carboxypeptidase regulatory-like domain-containing protein [Chloroflexota bacterium]
MMKTIKLAGLGLTVLLFGIWLRPLYAYEEIAVKDGATIRGSVKLEGALPKLAPLQITKNKEFCKDVPNETLIVGPGRGLRYAVVTLEDITKGKAVERETSHELDNIHCRFSPHVQAASVGQFVVLKNSDPILHTAHAFFTKEQPQFNVGLYPGRVSRKPLIAPGVVNVRCEVHPWMSAYIIVTDHPYHAISDLYGEYELSDVPPGTYRLKVWHESLGTQEKRIEVKPGAAQIVDFTFHTTAGVKR